MECMSAGPDSPRLGCVIPAAVALACSDHALL